jgi:ParB family chromosome partitioning protein
MILPPAERKVLRLPRDHVHLDPGQPRKEFDWDRLKELAASIRSLKQLVPVICRPHPEQQGHGILVDGERRWRALTLVPCDTIDAVMVDGPLDPGQLLLMQMSLGVSSRRLDPLEVGDGCQKLMQLYGLSPRELAERIGTSEGTISKLFRIVNGLAERLRADVKSGVLPFTVAYNLARLKEAAAQVDVADKFKAGLLKRDSVAAEVARRLDAGRPKQKAGNPVKAKTAGGLVVTLPPLNFDAVLAELATLAEAIKKLQKHGLPLQSLPAVLKS